MKIFVEHEENGTIHGIGVPAAGGSSTTVLRSSPGHLVSEVDAPDVQNEKDYDNLLKIKPNYRVEGYRENARLVRRV